MNKTSGLLAGAALAALAAAGGYVLGQRQAGVPAAPAAGAAPAPGAPQGARKPLYYRNPMGLPDTSPVPKKDPMGMDYIPVYADDAAPEAAAPGQVRISADKVQQLGVRTETVRKQVLAQTLRAAGRVEVDESRVFTVAPKFEGYVERLHVPLTGQPVASGQALFDVYSPELVSAQREYALAAQALPALKDAGDEAQAGMRQLAQASLQRLRNWDVPEPQLRQLADSAQVQRTLTMRSPVAGIVVEKKAVQGMRFMPGEMLFQVADLSRVWVLADVAEQDIGQVRPGAPAQVRIGAYPDKSFDARVSYVYPTLNAQTRTVPVRLELANPGLLLKPAMYAQVELGGAARAPALAVPLSAVIDSGTRQLVLLSLGQGRFAPRAVRLGQRSAEQVEVLDGLAEGDTVVVVANFLIDAESNLKAALGSFGQAAAPDAPAASAAGHHASGAVVSVDAQDGSASISHGPVASLKWPAMTMEFKAANSALLGLLKPGARIDFEFVERAPGEWVITSVRPAAALAK